MVILCCFEIDFSINWLEYKRKTGKAGSLWVEHVLNTSIALAPMDNIKEQRRIIGNQAWWCTPEILPLRRLTAELRNELQANLSFRTGPCLKQQQFKKKKKKLNKTKEKCF